MRLTFALTFGRNFRDVIDEYVKRTDDVHMFERRPSMRKVTLASGIKRKCVNSGANERLCEIDRANRR